MPEVESAVTAVTVYPDRARVTRTGKLSVESGSQSIQFRELPLGMDTASVRATARGSARVRLLGVQVNRDFYLDTPSGDARQIEEQVEGLQDELRLLQSRMGVLKQNRTGLEALLLQAQIYATALAAGETNIDTQLNLFESLRQRLESLEGEANQQEIEKRKLEKQIEKLKKELDKRSSARPRERYTAAVEVEVLEPGDLTVELAYVIARTGWTPLYDLRLEEQDGQPSLEVGYLAQISQNTGESWQDVELTLSTARPALAGRLPELVPWYIQPYTPPRPVQVPVPSMPRGGQRMVMAAKAEEAMPAMAEAAAEEVVATVDQAGTAITYRAPGKVSVPSDGAPHKVTVARFRLNPLLDYVTAPKLVQAAYRRAKVENDSPYTLLPGQANLFSGPEFIGSIPLELTAPQGEIELYLGTDDRIKVERELKRREVDKTLLGGRRRVHYGYEIKLENLTPNQAKIELQDQLPVGRHEEIKVRLESAEPKPQELSELNLLKWEFELASKEKQTVRFNFSVEYPQAMEITGLP